MGSIKEIEMLKWPWLKDYLSVFRSNKLFINFSSFRCTSLIRLSFPNAEKR